jgi:hypothetical protein
MVLAQSSFGTWIVPLLYPTKSLRFESPIIISKSNLRGKMRPPITRRPNVLRATSPELSYSNTGAYIPRGNNNNTTNNAANSNFACLTKNWVLIAIVLILVPGNIMVFSSGGKFFFS